MKMDMTRYIGNWGVSPSTTFGTSENPIIDFSQNLTDLDGGILENSEDDTDNFSDNFNEWLNRGKSNNVVYFGFQDGVAVYTGITRQLVSARLEQHNLKGKGFSRLEVQHRDLTRNQARSVEQYYIDHGPNKLNKINSLSPYHRFRSQADQWALTYLKKK